MKISKAIHVNLEQLKRKLSRSLSYAIICIFFAYATISCLRYSLISREQTTTTDVHRHCSETPEDTDCSSLQSLQFDKFLLFATDCWPVKYAKDVLEHYQEHSVSYLIDIPGAKYSHAIYTSYLTGQLPTNYQGDPILGDHLVRSMLRSQIPYKFRYIGPEWSFLAIFGKDNYDKFFEEVRVEKEALDVPFQHPYPFFFEGNWNFYQQYMDDMKRKEQSMFAHTGVFDHRQHGEHRVLGPAGKEFPRTDRMAKVLQSDMKQVKNWIDANPEYLLILLSDHGVDEYGVEGYRMHGTSINGNEPFLMIYNPRIKPKEEIRIDVVDVAPTLAMYLKNVDIPANSMGVAQPYFGTNRTDLDIAVLKRNLKQLSRAAENKGLSVDTATMETLFSSPVSESTFQELMAFTQQLKSNMYQVMHVPWGRVTIYVLVSSLVMLVILLSYNESLERFVLASDYVGFFREMWNILVVYGLMFLQLLYCWWSWSKAHDGGFVYRILSPGLALFILKNSHVPKMKDSQATAMIYKNETINLVIVLLSTCFPDLLSSFDEIPFMSEVTLLITLYAVYKLYQTNYFTHHSKTTMVAVMVLVVLIHWEMYTEEIEFYFVWHFHVFALLIYILAIVWPLYCMVKGNLLDIIIPINLVLFMLLRETNSSRWMLMLFNIQYLVYILPLIEIFRGLVRSTRKDPYSQASISHQAVCVYAINQVFLTFYFGYGDKINLDVHPFAGRVGLDGYDVYPSLSAFIMAFHKYGIFSLFSVYAWYTSHLEAGDEMVKFGKDKQTNVQPWADLMTCCILLLFAMTNLGTYLMWWVVTRHHPSQQASASTLLIGVMGTLFACLHVVDALRTSKQDAHKDMHNV